MTNYIVSARKYRPESFETLIGQDNIAQTLKNSISRGQLAHAYLFCGPRGVGKTTTARIFAKMINCFEPLENGDPCGKCESCVSFAEGRSYCIYEMDAASNNSVDDIKDLIDKVRIPPQVGKYSVYIIDEVHMLSQQAFNAFLKTLEEPPEYAIFILATTEKHKILPTILSRCQTYDFNRITVDNIVRNLRAIASKENITIDDESLHVIALKADGAMRDALTIFDQTVAFCGTEVKYEDVIRNLNVLDYEYSFSLVNNFLGGDYASALRTFDDILAKGFNALHFISALSSHLRDLMVAKAGGIDSLLELADSLKAKYRAQAATCSEKFLYDALALTTACEQGYRAAVNARLHIEFCLMRLCFLNRAASTAAPAAAPAPAQAPQPAAPAPVQPAAPVSPAPAVTPVSPAPQPAEQPAPVQPAAPVASQPVEAPTAPAQPVAPQPAAPAAAPAQPETPTRRRTPGASMGLSLSAITNQENQKDPAAAAAEALQDKDLSQEEIEQAWKALCRASAANQRLFNAVNTATLEVADQNGKKVVKYLVANASLRDWLDSKNSRIEMKLRELAGSSKIDLVVDVKPEDPSERIAVSPEDKVREMMEKTPQTRQWITDLGLEIK